MSRYNYSCANECGDEYIVKRNSNLIEIPDNATNGDVVKILFPDAGLSNLEAGHILTRFGNGCSIRADLNWWNAPYKKGEGD